METAAANGLSAGGGARLREISDGHWNAFRLGFRGDRPARVEPLTATFKPEARVVKTRGRAYSPVKTAWLATCIGTLVALGLVFRNMPAAWASTAMTAPKKGGFRLVGDYHAVNKQIEKVTVVMTNQELYMADLRGVTCFGKIELLQGYWLIDAASGRSPRSVHQRRPRTFVWRSLFFSLLLRSACSSIPTSRGVERCTQGNRCLTTGSA